MRNELLFLRHAMIGLRAVVAPPKPHALSYSEKSFLGVIGLLLLITGIPEIPIHHLLVPGDHWAVAVALDLCVLYSAFWVLGLFGVMTRRPHEITAERITFHRGPLASAHVERAAVREAHAIVNADIRELRRCYPAARFLAFKGADLVHVRLEQPATVLQHYPIRRESASSELFVASDRPHELCALLRPSIPQRDAGN